MVSLKQILIAVAATVISVHAVPLSTESATTAISLEGAIDVSNTTSSFDAQSDANELSKRGSACDQGDCPDFNAGFDFLTQRFVNAFQGSPIITFAYAGRVNDCGQCHRLFTSKDGCFDFTSCGRAQQICVDSGKARAHRIWKDNGHKTCYRADRHDYGNCGVGLTNSIIWSSGAETACNW
jgi:hypothetical protein